MRRRGRPPRIDRSTVDAVRRDLDARIKQEYIAEQYGISQPTVSRINRLHRRNTSR